MLERHGKKGLEERCSGEGAFVRVTGRTDVEHLGKEHWGKEHWGK
jgi:hypothetical protein